MTDGSSSHQPTSFSTPPHTYEDDEGRVIEIREYDENRDALIHFYEQFDSDDRAQGIPPVTKTRIESWLDSILTESIDVVAVHENQIIGHATLVPDPEGTGQELAIFVAKAYQGAGIGTQLVRTLVGMSATRDIDRIWLSVERWNAPAIRVYEKAGFERSGGESLEIKMELPLDDDQTESTG